MSQVNNSAKPAESQFKVVSLSTPKMEQLLPESSLL